MVRFWLLLSAAVVAGCSTMSDATSSVRERLAARDAGRTRTYASPQRDTYQAVRIAAEQMGYRFQRGGAAQGFFEAVSGIGQGDVLRTSRQIAMKVSLRPSLDEGTQVTVRLTEIIEAESSARAVSATEAPLQGTPQYEVFFRAVQQAIDAAGARQ
jgi:hypothetical protein